MHYIICFNINAGNKSQAHGVRVLVACVRLLSILVKTERFLFGWNSLQAYRFLYINEVAFAGLRCTRTCLLYQHIIMGNSPPIKASEVYIMIKPLNDFIVIQPTEVDEKTTGGIILMEESKDKPQTGVVVTVGAGRVMDDGKRIEASVAEGDKVIYSRYAGTEIAHKGHNLLLIREMDILAIIE